MNRADFLKMLGVGSVAAVVVEPESVAASSAAILDDWLDFSPEAEYALENMLQHKLGYRPSVRIEALPQTGAAQKYRVVVTGRDHVAVKNTLVCPSYGDERMEVAYVLTKRAMDAGKDIAFAEGIPFDGRMIGRARG